MRSSGTDRYCYKVKAEGREPINDRACVVIETDLQNSGVSSGSYQLVSYLSHHRPTQLACMDAVLGSELNTPGKECISIRDR